MRAGEVVRLQFAVRFRLEFLSKAPPYNPSVSCADSSPYTGEPSVAVLDLMFVLKLMTLVCAPRRADSFMKLIFDQF